MTYTCCWPPFTTRVGDLLAVGRPGGEQVVALAGGQLLGPGAVVLDGPDLHLAGVAGHVQDAVPAGLQGRGGDGGQGGRQTGAGEQGGSSVPPGRMGGRPFCQTGAVRARRTGCYYNDTAPPRARHVPPRRRVAVAGFRRPRIGRRAGEGRQAGRHDRGGRPARHRRPPEGSEKRAPEAAAGGEAQAVRFLVQWVKKITDAELRVADKPGDGPAIYVGKAAVRAGLKLDDIDSPTKEGIRIVVEDRRPDRRAERRRDREGRLPVPRGTRLPVLHGRPARRGVPAVARPGREAGHDHREAGPAVPQPEGADVEGRVLEGVERGRRRELSRTRTRGAGTSRRALFAEHPEYFAMGADGKRKDGDWLCTSNPRCGRSSPTSVIAAIKGGTKHPSISPPDGRGYCQCDKCKAQDDPKIIEPSSGSVSMSNRYADFFDDVGRQRGEGVPGLGAELLRLRRLHAAADGREEAVAEPVRGHRPDPLLPAARDRRPELPEPQAAAGDGRRVGRRWRHGSGITTTCTTWPTRPCPCSSTPRARSSSRPWPDEGLTYMTIEVLSNWYMYGPQIYLSLRLAYDPKLDAAASSMTITRSSTARRRRPMKAYWLGIDEATAKLAVPLRRVLRAGGGVHAGVLPGLRVAAEAGGRGGEGRQRVRGTGGDARGRVRNVLDYRAIGDAMAAATSSRRRPSTTEMVKRIDGLVAKGYANRGVRHRIPEAVPAEDHRRRRGGDRGAEQGRPGASRPVAVHHRRRRQGCGAELSGGGFRRLEVADGGDVLGDPQRSGIVRRTRSSGTGPRSRPPRGTAGWRSCSPRSMAG